MSVPKGYKFGQRKKPPPFTDKHKRNIALVQLGKKLSLATKSKIGKANKGRKHSKGARENMSTGRMGIRLTAEHRRKISEAHKAIREKSHLWKGGITTINQQIRTSLEYRLWREAVFKRDNWTCMLCGILGTKLNADHIKPFAYYPELRFAIDNGRTLCVPCHKTTETYGNRKEKKKSKN